ncbi:NADH dehydrogenase [Dictyostelium purpureum]|uniref:NADH dehydrogenase n=1 Tax=Dictyostelium purpureum TaxID=5786 RepID=F1A1R5_DICPU|nr:NADH dehydrogenase [Dictyostelium purpureum]EGC29873.1 NADH dehydrogenase [Dictyostelium purpureum]|eukprot:XP_003293610.1 NADH dehydrogenase [Dictyostelium purpureum]
MASNMQAIKQMRPAIVSLTQQQARKRCFKLYRNCMRSVPHLIQHYNLSYNISEMKARIRAIIISMTISVMIAIATSITTTIATKPIEILTANFEQFKDVEEVSQLDRLAFIGETELFDAMSLLKTRSHVVNYFDTPLESKANNRYDQLRLALEGKKKVEI